MLKTKNPPAEPLPGDEILKKHGQMKDIWRRFRSNKLAMVGLGIVAVLIFVAVFADLIAPYDYAAQSIKDRLQFPSRGHLLGTDNFGRDLLTRIIFGTRVSLLVSLMGLVLSLLVGGVLGATAGYFGGVYEGIVMRFTDILMSIPPMLLAICISALLGTGTINTAVAISIGGLAPSIRILRATVLTIRDQEYVEAARASGSGHTRIILRQILPNTLSPLIVDSTLRIGMNILQISMLSFIGLGVQPPVAEWGSIMNAGRKYITTFYPMLTFPGVAIMLTMFAFNVMGDGLRDALDPKLKR
ncbi:MAG: ABC transporter permease [Oscillospiraceae bacterium]|jgi:peptide/nickel transport system permease protein